MTQAKASMDFNAKNVRKGEAEEEMHVFLRQESSLSLSKSLNNAKDARKLNNYHVHLEKSAIYKPAGRF